MKNSALRVKPSGWPKDLPSPAEHHDVKVWLGGRGITLTEIAGNTGMGRSSCRMALHRPSSRRAERLIAKETGVRHADLFDPDFWKCGKRLKKKNRALGSFHNRGEK